MSTAAVLDRPPTLLPDTQQQQQGADLATLPEETSAEAGRREEIIDVHCGWGATTTAPEWNRVAVVEDALRERGISLAFVASRLARHFDPPEGNAQIAPLAPNGYGTPGSATLLRGWLVVQPDRPAEAAAQMRRHLYHSESFIGLALYPDAVSGRPITLRQTQDLLNAYRRFAKPLLIQAPTGEAMRHVGEIAREYSNMRVIASGMGGDDWREAADVAVKPLNLYLDISGALCSEKIIYAIEHLHGARKLLFASGAPDTDPAAVLGMLDDLDISPDDRARILSNNAQRLFQLQNTDAVQGSDLRFLSPEPAVDPDAPHLGNLDEG